MADKWRRKIMARLVIKNGGLSGSVIELNLGVNRVGRGSDADFQINHPTVSALHCELILSDGAVLIRDCGSTNGTFVNGKAIKEAIVLDGQIVHLGDVELVVETTEVTVAIPKFERPGPKPPVVLADGSILCPRHPQARATYKCTHCREVMCDACVHKLRRQGGKTLRLCPLCSHKCEPVGVEKPKKKSLLGFLQKTVKLPFLRSKRPTDSET
jgi:pSer/pThr/pTyr-binding forkhead associated (FHA) protein